MRARGRSACFVVTLALGCSNGAHAGPAPSASASLVVLSADAPSSAAPATSASAAVDTTSGASAAYAPAGPSVVAGGKVDGAALRKRHKDRLSHDMSPVTLLEGGSPIELGTRICEAVVPRRPADTPILLKPNICGFDGMKDAASHGGDNGVRGRTTDPEFVRGVVQCLKKRGHTKITIAEGCGLAHEGFEKLLDISGYAAMARSEGVTLVGINDDGFYDKQGDQPGLPLALDGIADTAVPTLLVPKALAETLDRGLFISIPKIKTHRFSVVSLGVKGMQGVVMLGDHAPAHQQKWRMHKELNDYLKENPPDKQPDDRAKYVDALMLFSERMAAVLEIEAPDVVLAEGTPAEGGDGFSVLEPYGAQVAIGGTNPITVDKVGAQFLGLWNSDKLALGLRGHKTSPLIEVAAKRFGIDLDHVEVSGNGRALLDAPRPVHFKAIAPFGIDFEPPPPKPR